MKKLLPLLLLLPLMGCDVMEDLFGKETIVEVALCADGDNDGFGHPTAQGCATDEIDTCPAVKDFNNDPASCADDPPPPPANDADGDGVPDGEDNCPRVANGPSENDNQGDFNGDGFGDACQERVNVSAEINCRRAEGEIRIGCVSDVEDERGAEVNVGVETYRWDLNIGDDFTGITERTREVATFFPPAEIACEGNEGVVFNVLLTLRLRSDESHAYVTEDGQDTLIVRAVNDNSDNLRIPDAECA